MYERALANYTREMRAQMTSPYGDQWDGTSPRIHILHDPESPSLMLDVGGTSTALPSKY